MKTPFTMTGPKGKLVTVAQLEFGETVQAGDWFLALGHLKCDWHGAEPGAKIGQSHLPHVRIIQPTPCP